MKKLFISFLTIGVIIAGGYYADAQLGLQSPGTNESESGETGKLVRAMETDSDKDDTEKESPDEVGKNEDSASTTEKEPEPGSLAWLKIHYPEAYTAALEAEQAKHKAEKSRPVESVSSKKMRRAFADKRLDYQPALVLIKGDNGSGTGFICKVRDIPCLVTNIHILGCADAAGSFDSGMDELIVETLDGRELTPLSIYGAKAHDLCLIRFAEEKDYEDVALTFEPDVGGTVQEGDPVVIPGNSKGSGTMVWTDGDVVGIGPKKIEHNAPVYEGNSGSPIIHIPSGRVIGVLSYAEQVSIDSFYDEEAYNDKRSAIKNKIRYFGYRLDSAKQWYGIDLRKFCRQNEELETFTLQRQNVALFLYTDEKSWRTDKELVDVIDYANDQVDRKAINGRIGHNSLREISISVSKLLNSLVMNDTYRNYQRYIRSMEATGQSNMGYYSYFNDSIKREVQIRKLLARNLRDWEKRLRN